jgi:secondary thiamine-phosphate synthase enzyme
VSAFRLVGPESSIGPPSVVDITEEVVDAVQESGVSEGICCVYSLHTTAVIRVNEFEAGIVDDFTRLLGFLAPATASSGHDRWENRDDPRNEDARCTSMLLGPAGESIPVADGKLCLGTWQRVLFLELDGLRSGRWTVQVVGS